MPATPSVIPFVRASSLHIGAAAATVALREELNEKHGLPGVEVDRAYAVSRLTPGTNQLAIYAVLGHRLGGWSLALQAVVVGATLPSVIAVLVAMLYTHTDSPLVAAIMRGARAGGVAVFIGSAARLMRPQLINQRVRASALALVIVGIAALSPASAFVILLLAGAAGAVVLRP